MSTKTYHNISNVYESIICEAKPFIGKTLSADYIVLSEGLAACFDFPISDAYEVEELAEEVIMTLNTIGANYIRIYEPENNKTVYETACYHGGVNELTHLKNKGILEDEGVPTYFKEFISLKTKLIAKINEEKDVIANLYKSRNDKDTRTPFIKNGKDLINGRICSSLFASREIMSEKIEDAIFTNEEYEALLECDFLSWFVSDLHSEEMQFFEDPEDDFYMTVEECFYCAAEQLLAVKNFDKNNGHNDSSPINK